MKIIRHETGQLNSFASLRTGEIFSYGSMGEFIVVGRPGDFSDSGNELGVGDENILTLSLRDNELIEFFDDETEDLELSIYRNAALKLNG